MNSPAKTRRDNNPTALVAASYGRHLLIETQDGVVRPARPANRRIRCVCGDRVELDPAAPDPIVTAVLPRQSVLWRQDSREGRRAVAANIDCMLILVSPRPGSSPEQIDRYIAIAELLAFKPLILRGKADIADAAFDTMLDEFVQLGYPVVPVSADGDAGLAELGDWLEHRKAILCGLSGAGKSSLFNALLPEAAQRTTALSAASGEGRHTTTSTLLHRLPCGGWLIDSPGVRDIRLWPMTANELLAGFTELLPLESACRFANCSHQHEPACAIRMAVEGGEVGIRRYRSLCELAERLKA